MNDAIWESRQDLRDLARGAEAAEAGDVAFLTNDGERKFSEGERIVFHENNRDLGVKNGMLRVVESVAEGLLMARLDSATRPGAGSFRLHV